MCVFLPSVVSSFLTSEFQKALCSTLDFLDTLFLSSPYAVNIMLLRTSKLLRAFTQFLILESVLIFLWKTWNLPIQYVHHSSSFLVLQTTRLLAAFSKASFYWYVTNHVLLVRIRSKVTVSLISPLLSERLNFYTDGKHIIRCIDLSWVTLQQMYPGQ